MYETEYSHIIILDLFSNPYSKTIQTLSKSQDKLLASLGNVKNTRVIELVTNCYTDALLCDNHTNKSNCLSSSHT